MTLIDCMTTDELETELTRLDPDTWLDEYQPDEDTLAAMVDRLLSE